MAFRFKTLLAVGLFEGLCACATPAKRPPPPQTLTVADFNARLDCITKKLGRGVRATDSETELVSQAQAAVEICSGSIWDIMRAREPRMSPYREIVVDRDRNDVMPWAIAQAHDIRETLRQFQPLRTQLTSHVNYSRLRRCDDHYLGRGALLVAETPDLHTALARRNCDVHLRSGFQHLASDRIGFRGVRHVRALSSKTYPG